MAAGPPFRRHTGARGHRTGEHDERERHDAFDKISGGCGTRGVRVRDDRAGDCATDIRDTAVAGERRVTATPARTTAFLARLQPDLPTGTLLPNGPDACKMYATGRPSADETWRGTAGSGHLVHDDGCDRAERRPLAEALRCVPHRQRVRSQV